MLYHLTGVYFMNTNKVGHTCMSNFVKSFIWSLIARIVPLVSDSVLTPVGVDVFIIILQ